MATLSLFKLIVSVLHLLFNGFLRRNVKDRGARVTSEKIDSPVPLTVDRYFFPPRVSGLADKIDSRQSCAQNITPLSFFKKDFGNRITQT